MLKIGFTPKDRNATASYVRFYPNFGFTLKVWPKRWLHYCTKGHGLLKPGQFCKR